jgi:hypothetical protein
LNVVTPTYIAQSVGTIDIPDLTVAATSFPIPVGTVTTDISCLVIRNTNNQDMILHLNGSAGLFRIVPGGEIMIGQPAVVSGGVPTPLVSAAVETTAASQVGNGTLQYFVFGI